MTAKNTRAVFHDVPIFPVLGLHDFLVPFTLPNSSDWYETILNYWAPLVVCDGCPVDANKPTTMAVLRKTFLEGGYYNASIAGILLFLVLLTSLKIGFPNMTIQAKPSNVLTLPKVLSGKNDTQFHCSQNMYPWQPLDFYVQLSFLDDEGLLL